MSNNYGVFFMTKYSSEFKIDAVLRYQNETISIKSLANELTIGIENLRTWIELSKEQGLGALKVKKSHNDYNLDFKLNVVKYYQNHDLGTRKVAAKFNISPSQVNSWNKKFEVNGAAGLISKSRGGPRMNKKKKIVNKSDVSLTEKQKYEQKIMELEKKIHDIEFENYVLKKLPLRSTRSQTKKKQ